MQNRESCLSANSVKDALSAFFSKKRLCLAAFSFVCSFSLTFPFWAGGQSLLLCVLEAVPLSLVVCLVLNALLRVGFEVGADSFSSKAKLFALSFGSLAVLWGGYI